MKTPVPSKPSGLLARVIPGLVVALVVAGLTGGIAFYVSAQILADDMEELTDDVEDLETAADEIGGLRVDVGRLVEKVSAANVADAERHERLDARLGRIEAALDAM